MTVVELGQELDLHCLSKLYYLGGVKDAICVLGDIEHALDVRCSADARGVASGGGVS